jgi:hypothetical protein
LPSHHIWGNVIGLGASSRIFFGEDEPVESGRTPFRPEEINKIDPKRALEMKEMKMRATFVLTVAGIAAVAGVANAGSVGGDVLLGALPTSNTSGAQLGHYTTFFGAAAQPVTQSGVTGVAGATLSFGSIGTGEVTSSMGNFYLGTAAGLNAVQPTVWFNTIVGGLGAVGNDTTVLGFANNGAFSDNTVTVNFQPGVQGFIFNFADIGDASIAELVVTWSDGTYSDVALTTNNDPTGFVSLLADAGKTINSVTLSQDLDRNDGFMFYGFNTLAVVPLPPAAWAGLAMLGGIAGVRKLRRRG